MTILKDFRVLLSLVLLAPLPLLAAAPEGLSVSGAYARSLPPTLPNTSAYMRLRNESGQDLRLSGVSTPAAASVSLHETVEEGGQLMMRAVPGLLLPAGGEVLLEPGGLHWMLMDLQAPLAPGAEIDFSLRFEDGSSLDLRLPVRSVFDEGSEGDSHQHHH